MQAFRAIPIALTALVAASPTVAQLSRDTSDAVVTYDPLVYSKDGVVSSCGIQFTLVFPSLFAIQGSFNVYAERGREGVVVKMVARQGGPALTSPIRSIAVNYAAITIERGGLSLTGDLKRFPSDDGFAWTAGQRFQPGDGELLRGYASVFAALPMVGFRLVYRLDKQEFDQTIRVLTTPSEKTVATFWECLAPWRITPLN